MTDLAPHPADQAPQAGRTPPHNFDAEQAVLGAMLLSTDSIAAAIETITTVEHFYKPAHRHVYDAITTLYAAGEVPDPTTVAEALQRAGLLDQVGGAGFLIELERNTPATSNTVYYARIVEERALMRALIGRGQEIAQLGWALPDDVDEAIDTAQGLLFQLAERRMTNSMASFDEILEPFLDRAEELQQGRGSLLGVPSGFKALDNIVGGSPPGGLMVIGARPSMGKTALALAMATQCVHLTFRPAVLFSMEMSHFEVSLRIVCAEAQVNSKNLRSGKLSNEEWRRLSNAMSRLDPLLNRLHIDDGPAQTALEIRAKCRRLKSRLGDLGLVVVDYLQLMRARGRAENRNLEVAEISRDLKTLARELDCPVVALSQLSRGVEGRQDKRPTLGDLRDSGSIEQDADVVVFLYRDAVYNRDEPDDGDTELIVAKNRNGPIGTAHVTFLKHYAKFVDQAPSL